MFRCQDQKSFPETRNLTPEIPLPSSYWTKVQYTDSSNSSRLIP